jgi:hypothetical protein
MYQINSFAIQSNGQCSYFCRPLLFLNGKWEHFFWPTLYSTNINISIKLYYLLLTAAQHQITLQEVEHQTRWISK